MMCMPYFPGFTYRTTSMRYVKLFLRARIFLTRTTVTASKTIKRRSPTTVPAMSATFGPVFAPLFTSFLRTHLPFSTTSPSEHFRQSSWSSIKVPSQSHEVRAEFSVKFVLHLQNPSLSAWKRPQELSQVF